MPLGSRILTLPAFLVCSVYTFQLVGKVEFSLLFFSFLSFSVQEAATLFGLSSEFTITAVWLLAGNGPQLMMSRDELLPVANGSDCYVSYCKWITNNSRARKRQYNSFLVDKR